MRTGMGERIWNQAEHGNDQDSPRVGADQGSPRRATSLLDPKFAYTPSAQTDLKKTFARIRREQRAQEQSNRDAAEERLRKVVGEIKERKSA